MSILNAQTEQFSTEKKAARVKFLTRGVFEQAINVWNKNNEMIWNDPNPQDVLDALGDDAAEIINLDDKIVAFLSDGLSGTDRQADLDEILSKKGSRPEITTENGRPNINRP